MLYTNPIDSPYGESCPQTGQGVDPSVYLIPPAAFVLDPSASGDVNLASASEWRLTSEIRQYAQAPANAPSVSTRTPLSTLVAAAIKRARGDIAGGNAVADLSVSGRLSYE